MRRDTLFYVAPEPTAEAAWPGDVDQLGRQLGRFTWEGAGLLSQQLPHLTSPGAYDGAGALVEDYDQAMRLIERSA